MYEGPSELLPSSIRERNRDTSVNGRCTGGRSSISLGCGCCIWLNCIHHAKCNRATLRSAFTCQHSHLNGRLPRRSPPSSRGDGWRRVGKGTPSRLPSSSPLSTGTSAHW